MHTYIRVLRVKNRPTHSSTHAYTGRGRVVCTRGYIAVVVIRVGVTILSDYRCCGNVRALHYWFRARGRDTCNDRVRGVRGAECCGD